MIFSMRGAPSPLTVASVEMFMFGESRVKVLPAVDLKGCGSKEVGSGVLAALVDQGDGNSRDEHGCGERDGGEELHPTSRWFFFKTRKTSMPWKIIREQVVSSEVILR